MSAHINKGKINKNQFYLITLTRKTMKKIIFTLSLIVAIVLGTTTITNATTVRFYLKIYITDNSCPPLPYNGYYCVQWKLQYNGSDLCTTTRCNLLKGSNCVQFECDIPDNLSADLYGVQVVNAARYPSGNCPNSSFSPTSGWSWASITDSSCPDQVNITL